MAQQGKLEIITKKKIFLVVLYLVSMVYLFPLISAPVNVYDEGIILAGAERVQKGHVPCTDFWTIYPPGQFYTLASLFDIFGTSVLVERIYDILIKSLIALLGFLIVRKYYDSLKAALLSWAMLVLWIGYSGNPASSVYPAIVFIFISLYLTACYLDTTKVYWLMSSALPLAVSALFRLDLAKMTAFTLLIMLVIRTVKDKSIPRVHLIYYLLSLIFVSIYIFLYLIISIDFQTLYNQLIATPLELILQYLSLPYPLISLITVPFLVFLLVIVAGLFTSSVLIFKEDTGDTITCGLILFSLMGLFFFIHPLLRIDLIHLLPMALISIILIPMLTAKMSVMANSKSYLVIKRLFIIILSIVFILATYKRVLTFKNDYMTAIKKSPIERAGYSKLSDDLKDVILFIQTNTSEDEFIYVGVTNHDQLSVNDVIIYFLSARKYASKYHELHRGVTNTLEVQKTMIENLKNSSPRIIVLADRDGERLDSRDRDSEVNMLDDYISSHYELKVSYGLYRVLMEK